MMAAGSHDAGRHTPDASGRNTRQANRRTVAVLAVLALAVYLGFIALMALNGPAP